MSVRLFVGNLPYDATETALAEFLSAVGKPLSVRLLTDRETGRPRGFGFVEYSDPAQAEEVVRRFHQQLFNGRPLVINEARPRDAAPPPRAPSFPQGDSGAPPVGAGRPTRQRSFGPDAPARGTRKRSHGAKGERAPKRPIPERTNGQFFAGSVDDLDDDQGADDVAFWARAAAEEE